MAILLGIDYGRRRTGLAISDPGERLAVPLEVLHHANQAELIEGISRVCRERRVEKIVVGLPVNMDESEGDSAVRARRFADELHRRVQLPVALTDERLTTVEAEERMIRAGFSRQKRRRNVDALAAQVLLQDFLDEAR